MDQLLICALPGDGWMAHYERDGVSADSPVVAWLVYADGHLEAMVTDGQGEVMAAAATALHHLWHPLQNVSREPVQ